MHNLPFPALKDIPVSLSICTNLSFFLFFSSGKKRKKDAKVQLKRL